MSDSSWRVLGYERFAREECLIGEFPSRAVTEAAVREAERRHELTQDAPLRFADDQLARRPCTP